MSNSQSNQKPDQTHLQNPSQVQPSAFNSQNFTKTRPKTLYDNFSKSGMKPTLLQQNGQAGYQHLNEGMIQPNMSFQGNSRVLSPQNKLTQSLDVSAGEFRHLMSPQSLNKRKRSPVDVRIKSPQVLNYKKSALKGPNKQSILKQQQLQKVAVTKPINFNTIAHRKRSPPKSKLMIASPKQVHFKGRSAHKRSGSKTSQNIQRDSCAFLISPQNRLERTHLNISDLADSIEKPSRLPNLLSKASPQILAQSGKIGPKPPSRSLVTQSLKNPIPRVAQGSVAKFLSKEFKKKYGGKRHQRNFTSLSKSIVMSKSEESDAILGENNSSSMSPKDHFGSEYIKNPQQVLNHIYGQNMHSKTPKAFTGGGSSTNVGQSSSISQPLRIQTRHESSLNGSRQRRVNPVQQEINREQQLVRQQLEYREHKNKVFEELLLDSSIQEPAIIRQSSNVQNSRSPQAVTSPYQTVNQRRQLQSHIESPSKRQIERNRDQTRVNASSVALEQMRTQQTQPQEAEEPRLNQQPSGQRPQNQPSNEIREHQQAADRIAVNNILEEKLGDIFKGNNVTNSVIMLVNGHARTVDHDDQISSALTQLNQLLGNSNLQSNQQRAGANQPSQERQNQNPPESSLVNQNDSIQSEIMSQESRQPRLVAPDRSNKKKKAKRCHATSDNRERSSSNQGSIERKTDEEIQAFIKSLMKIPKSNKAGSKRSKPLNNSPQKSKLRSSGERKIASPKKPLYSKDQAVTAKNGITNINIRLKLPGEESDQSSRSSPNNESQVDRLNVLATSYGDPSNFTGSPSSNAKKVTFQKNFANFIKESLEQQEKLSEAKTKKAKKPSESPNKSSANEEQQAEESRQRGPALQKKWTQVKSITQEYPKIPMQVHKDKDDSTPKISNQLKQLDKESEKINEDFTQHLAKLDINIGKPFEQDKKKATPVKSNQKDSSKQEKKIKMKTHISKQSHLQNENSSGMEMNSQNSKNSTNMSLKVGSIVSNTRRFKQEGQMNQNRSSRDTSLKTSDQNMINKISTSKDTSNDRKKNSDQNVSQSLNVKQPQVMDNLKVPTPKNERQRYKIDQAAKERIKLLKNSKYQRNSSFTNSSNHSEIKTRSGQVIRPINTRGSQVKKLSPDPEKDRATEQGTAEVNKHISEIKTSLVEVGQILKQSKAFENINQNEIYGAIINLLKNPGNKFEKQNTKTMPKKSNTVDLTDSSPESSSQLNELLLMNARQISENSKISNPSQTFSQSPISSSKKNIGAHQVNFIGERNQNWQKELSGNSKAGSRFTNVDDQIKEVSISQSQTPSHSLSDLEVQQNKKVSKPYVKQRTAVSKDSKQAARQSKLMEGESDFESSKKARNMNKPICEVKESETESTPPDKVVAADQKQESSDSFKSISRIDSQSSNSDDSSSFRGGNQSSIKIEQMDTVAKLPPTKRKQKVDRERRRASMIKMGKRSNSQTQIQDDSLGKEIKATAEPQIPIFEINMSKNYDEGDTSPDDTEKKSLMHKSKVTKKSIQEKEVVRVTQESQKKNEKSGKTPSDGVSNKYYAESKYSKEYVKQTTKLSHISSHQESDQLDKSEQLEKSDGHMSQLLQCTPRNINMILYEKGQNKALLKKKRKLQRMISNISEEANASPDKEINECQKGTTSVSEFLGFEALVDQATNQNERLKFNWSKSGIASKASFDDHPGTKFEKFQGISQARNQTQHEINSVIKSRLQNMTADQTDTSDLPFDFIELHEKVKLFDSSKERLMRSNPFEQTKFLAQVREDVVTIKNMEKNISLVSAFEQNIKLTIEGALKHKMKKLGFVQQKNIQSRVFEKLSEIIESQKGNQSIDDIKLQQLMTRNYKTNIDHESLRQNINSKLVFLYVTQKNIAKTAKLIGNEQMSKAKKNLGQSKIASMVNLKRQGQSESPKNKNQITEEDEELDESYLEKLANQKEPLSLARLKANSIQPVVKPLIKFNSRSVDNELADSQYFIDEDRGGMQKIMTQLQDHIKKLMKTPSSLQSNVIEEKPIEYDETESKKPALEKPKKMETLARRGNVISGARLDVSGKMKSSLQQVEHDDSKSSHSNCEDSKEQFSESSSVSEKEECEEHDDCEMNAQKQELKDLDKYESLSKRFQEPKILQESKLQELEDTILIIDRCGQHLIKVQDKVNNKKRHVDRSTLFANKGQTLKDHSEFKKVNFNSNKEDPSEDLSSHSSIFITSEGSQFNQKGENTASEWGFEQVVNSSNENLNQQEVDQQTMEAIQYILSRKFFTSQIQRDTLKIVKIMENRISFFNNSRLGIIEFEKIQLSQISLILDNFRIDKKLIFEKYVKDFVGDVNSKKRQSKYNLQTLASIYNDFLVDQAKKSKHFYDSIYLQTNTQEGENLLFSAFDLQRLLVKQTNLIEELTQTRKEFVEWKSQQLQIVKKFNLIGPSYLIKLQNDMFWSNQSETVKVYLNTLDKASQTKNSSRLDLDSKSQTSLKSMWDDEEKELIASSSQSLSADTMNDGIDGHSVAEVESIFMMHQNFNPSLLLKQILMKKNAAYEIFLILSQTQIDLIQKKIIQTSSIETTMRQEYVEERIKQIQQVINQQCKEKLQGLEFMLRNGEIVNNQDAKFFNLLMGHHNDDDESLDQASVDSNNSIQQTAVYSFVENYEKQLVTRKKLLEEEQMQIEIQKMQDYLMNDNSMTLQEKLNYTKVNKKVKIACGFRYGKLATKEGQEKAQRDKLNEESTNSNIQLGANQKNIFCNFKQKLGILYDSEQTAIQREAEAQAGSVRLLNGLPLNLSQDTNVDFSIVKNSTQPNKVQLEKLNVIQSYYDLVKNEIRSSQYEDNMIIKYQKSRLLNEHEINAIQQGLSLKKLNDKKIAKYTNAKKLKPAVNIDLTTFALKEYRNPFKHRNRYPSSSDTEETEMQRFEQERKRDLKQKYFCESESSELSNTFATKKTYKCDDYIIKCKLQSLANFQQVNILKDEIHTFQVGNSQKAEGMKPLQNSIENFQSAYVDPRKKIPVFQMFEIIHVFRKTEKDEREQFQQGVLKQNKMMQKMAFLMTMKTGKSSIQRQLVLTKNLPELKKPFQSFLKEFKETQSEKAKHINSNSELDKSSNVLSIGHAPSKVQIFKPNDIPGITGPQELKQVALKLNVKTPNINSSNLDDTFKIISQGLKVNRQKTDQQSPQNFACLNLLFDKNFMDLEKYDRVVKKNANKQKLSKSMALDKRRTDKSSLRNSENNRSGISKFEDQTGKFSSTQLQFQSLIQQQRRKSIEKARNNNQIYDPFKIQMHITQNLNQLERNRTLRFDINPQIRQRNIQEVSKVESDFKTDIFINNSVKKLTLKSIKQNNHNGSSDHEFQSINSSVDQVLSKRSKFGTSRDLVDLQPKNNLLEISRQCSINKRINFRTKNQTQNIDEKMANKKTLMRAATKTLNYHQSLSQNRIKEIQENIIREYSKNHSNTLKSNPHSYGFTLRKWNNINSQKNLRINELQLTKQSKGNMAKKKVSKVNDTQDQDKESKSLSSRLSHDDHEANFSNMFNNESNKATYSPANKVSSDEDKSESHSDSVSEENSSGQNIHFQIEGSQDINLNVINGTVSDKNNGKGQNSQCTIQSALKRSKLITKHKFEVDSEMSGMDQSFNQSASDEMNINMLSGKSLSHRAVAQKSIDSFDNLRAVQEVQYDNSQGRFEEYQDISEFDQSVINSLKSNQTVTTNRYIEEHKQRQQSQNKEIKKSDFLLQHQKNLALNSRLSSLPSDTFIPKIDKITFEKQSSEDPRDKNKKLYSMTIVDHRNNPINLSKKKKKQDEAQKEVNKKPILKNNNFRKILIKNANKKPQLEKANQSKSHNHANRNIDIARFGNATAEQRKSSEYSSKPTLKQDSLERRSIQLNNNQDEYLERGNYNNQNLQYLHQKSIKSDKVNRSRVKFAQMLNQPSTQQHQSEDHSSLMTSDDPSEHKDNLQQQSPQEISKKLKQNLRVTRQLKKINTIQEGSEHDHTSSLSDQFSYITEKHEETNAELNNRERTSSQSERSHTDSHKNQAKKPLFIASNPQKLNQIKYPLNVMEEQSFKISPLTDQATMKKNLYKDEDFSQAVRSITQQSLTNTHQQIMLPIQIVNLDHQQLTPDDSALKKKFRRDIKLPPGYKDIKIPDSSHSINNQFFLLSPHSINPNIGYMSPVMPIIQPGTAKPSLMTLPRFPGSVKFRKRGASMHLKRQNSTWTKNDTPKAGNFSQKSFSQISMGSSKSMRTIEISQFDTKKKNHMEVLNETMFQAIKNQQAMKVMTLINKIQSLEVKDPIGNTFLNTAVQAGCLKIVQIFTDRGSLINTQNNLGNTPLHYANALGYNHILGILIQFGADEKIKNKRGKTPWEGI